MSTETIRSIDGETIADSRGMPALRVMVRTENFVGNFDVPSGASTGIREARELRDPDGRGLLRAIELIRSVIAPALVGIDISAQKHIDEILLSLDGTPDKSHLGGNSMIGVSIAAARASARAANLPLFEYLRSLATITPSRKTPRLFVNLINGGKHATGGGPFQEHQIITLSDDPREALQTAETIESALHALLTARDRAFTLGDEGGVAFPVLDVQEPFRLLAEAAESCGLRDVVDIGTDIAASSFFENDHYTVLGTVMNATDLNVLYASLMSSCGLSSIEDPFAENDIGSFADFHARNPKTLVIGDDLTTTNAAWIERAAQASAINAVIIKPNQAGTLSETLEAMRVAREHGIHCIVSHRSGETLDDFIADLAFAFGCYGLKAGAPRARERAVKYKRLIEIAHD